MKTRILGLLLACCTQWLCLYAVELSDLKVEYASCPIGIDVSHPRFSWQMKADEGERGLKQMAYQIRVFAENGTCVWDSQQVKEDVSLNIGYAGKPLQAETRYDWEVKVWTNQGETCTERSWFETGLMARNDRDAAWHGAQWIGGGEDDLTFYSHYLPVFRLHYAFRLDSVSQSLKTSFVYGANDERLMDKNKNLYGLANEPDKSYIRVELDATPLREKKAALLKIYRIGFCPTDKADAPLQVFQLPETALNRSNCYREHTLTLASELGFTRIYFDKESMQIEETNLNPLGQGGDFIAFPVVGDFIAFPVVGDVGFYQFKDRKQTALRLDIANYRSPANVLTSVTPALPVVHADGEGSLSVINPSRNSAPMLRTVFTAGGKKIAKARLYVTARGIYEVYMNGTRIGNDYFNPGATQYNRTHLYQTFDVTRLVNEGENALGAILSEGWWSGGCTFSGNNWNYFGDRQSLLAKLVITYEDGETMCVVTHPDTWKYYGDGPLVYGSFFQGEVYDARKESQVAGWSAAAYDDRSWKPACIVPLEGTVSTEGGGNSPRVDGYSDYHLIGQFGQTVKALKELTAQSVEEVRPGVFVYDMGQNMVGVPRICLVGADPSQRICLRYAEVKYPALPRYAGHEGMIMLENIRAAMAQDIYIARGGEEEIAPRFTYHGYRFIEITGIDRALPLEAVKGTVLSSVDRLVSHYETSNPQINRLWENITWSTFGNFLSIPTDCPQRNERMGWAGDISVFSRTATYLADAPQFLRRYLRAMRDVQREDGRFPDIAPLGGGFGGMLWGSAGITVPWECYLQYQDKALLEEHYPAMKRYIHYIQAKCIDPETHIIRQENVWGNLSDWLGLEDSRNDAGLLWEAYFIYDLQLMSRMADILGKTEDAARFDTLCKERTDFFNRTYLNQETGETRFATEPDKEVDTQTSYVLPLAFGIVPEAMARKVAACLAQTVMRENRTDNGVKCPPYSLMTGFIGTAWICKALSDYGYNEIAYRLLQQTSYPSWLYSVEQGATTIWERLNSYTHTDGFGENNRMNSFNHYSFGAVGAWMYGYSLGICRDEQSPGFQHFILKPVPDPTGKMTYAQGYYDSMYGRIESSWRIHPEAVEYVFTVPANTCATLYLPASETGKVSMDGEKLTDGTLMKNDTDGGTYVQIELGSGTYRFEVMR